MSRRWKAERVARTILWVMLAFAAIAWIARRLLGGADTAWLNTVVTVLLVIALPLGIFVARQPREIEPTGDRLFDEEINRVLDERAKKDRESNE